MTPERLAGKVVKVSRQTLLAQEFVKGEIWEEISAEYDATVDEIFDALRAHIDAQQRTIEQLQEQVESLNNENHEIYEAIFKNHPDGCAYVGIESSYLLQREMLEKRIEQLEKDKARLDWLEDHWISAECDEGGGWYLSGKYCPPDEGDPIDIEEDGKILREAIDNAKNAKGGQR